MPTKTEVYKYIHTQDEWIITNIKDREPFTSGPDQFLSYTPDGKITVHASIQEGYAWDGCTPKKEIAHLLLGVPDGAINRSTGKPYTYYASMFHDAICQYKATVPFSRLEADIIFEIMLTQANFKWARLYGAAVKNYARVTKKWPRTETDPNIKVLDCSWR